MPEPASDEFDLFISYAHADNEDGWVTALVEAIVAEHARFTPTPLRLFFDSHAIMSMSDWEHRILTGLRESKLMLVALSPAYFGSEYCRREWELYLDHELSQAMPGEAIAPIYIATHPTFEEQASDALNEWMHNLKRRQYVDVRNWRSEGPRALQHEDVRVRLALMDQQISERLKRVTRVKASPTTIPEHNDKFVGRTNELRQLREALALGRVGAITALHGIGGVGKSALAFEYAHAYADTYPDGRYLVPCDGVRDIRDALLKLVPQLDITLNESEQRDINAAVARVKRLLEERRRTLLVFDNVDDPQVLAPQQCAKYLPDAAKVHILATTRLGPDRFQRMECVALDALPENDALKLLENHRPISRKDDREWKAALRIVNRLGGHSLAVEVVSVFLWQNPDISYADYLARLEEEGLAAVDGAAEDDSVQLSRHTEKMIGPLLEPTLQALSPEERAIVEIAALLPPDSIAETWLLEIGRQRCPLLQQEKRPGHPDPWKRIIRRLAGLRLLTPAKDGQLLRMHRILQEVVSSGAAAEGDGLRGEIDELTRQRARALWNGWTDPEALWELTPLLDYAHLRITAGDPFGAWLANRLSEPLKRIGRLAESRVILRRALALQQEACPADDRDLAAIYSNLSLLERALGDLPAASEFLSRAIEIWERQAKPGSDILCTAYSNLAQIEKDLGKLERAGELLRSAIQGWEKAAKPNYSALVVAYSSLSNVEGELANYQASRELQERALHIAREKVYLQDHPTLAGCYTGLASLEMLLANFPAARDLHEQALTIRQRVFSGDHPVIASSLSAVGSLEQELANYSQARVCQERALAIREKVFGSENHPVLAKSYSALASLEQVLANFDAARELHERALAMREALFEPDHAVLASSYAALGAWHQELANYETSRELQERALAIREKSLEADHPTLSGSYTALAAYHELFGNTPEARRLHDLAFEIRRKAYGPDHPKTAGSVAALAAFHLKDGDEVQARLMYEQARDVRVRVYGEDHPVAASSYSDLASLESRAQNHQGARQLHERALTIRERAFGPDHPKVASSLCSLSTLLRSLGEHRPAREFLERALAIDEARYPLNHPAIARDLSLLAALLVSSDDRKLARELMTRALGIRIERLGEDHKLTRQCQSWLEQQDSVVD